MKIPEQDTLEDVLREDEKQNRNTNPAIDLLKLYFDISYVESNLVYNFDSCLGVNDGNFITQEAIVLNSVL